MSLYCEYTLWNGRFSYLRSMDGHSAAPGKFSYIKAQVFVATCGYLGLEGLYADHWRRNRDVNTEKSMLGDITCQSICASSQASPSDHTALKSARPLPYPRQHEPARICSQVAVGLAQRACSKARTCDVYCAGYIAQSSLICTPSAQICSRTHSTCPRSHAIMLTWVRGVASPSKPGRSGLSNSWYVLSCVPQPWALISEAVSPALGR